MTRRLTRRAVPTATAIAVLALLAACSGDGEPAATNATTDVELTEVEGEDPSAATAAPAPAPEDVAAAEPQAPQPLGPVTLAYPDGFAALPDAPAEGPFVLAPPEPQGGDPVITVTVEPATKMTAAEYAQTLVDMAEGTEQASGVEQGPVDWPGADEAHFVAMDAQVATTDGEVATTREALVLKVADTVYVATAAAPQDAFEGSGVGEALRTVRVAG